MAQQKQDGKGACGTGRGGVVFGALCVPLRLALGGLFIHSLSTGQDLPVWPAVAVILVNLIGAAKIVIGVRNAKKLRREQSGKVKPK